MKAKAKRRDFSKRVNVERGMPALHYYCYQCEAMICFCDLIAKETVKNQAKASCAELCMAIAMRVLYKARRMIPKCANGLMHTFPTGDMCISPFL